MTGTGGADTRMVEYESVDFSSALDADSPEGQLETSPRGANREATKAQPSPNETHSHTRSAGRLRDTR